MDPPIPAPTTKSKRAHRREGSANRTPSDARHLSPRYEKKMKLEDTTTVVVRTTPHPLQHPDGNGVAPMEPTPERISPMMSLILLVLAIIGSGGISVTCAF